jgi:hydroxyacylglutathione hydrolase
MSASRLPSPTRITAHDVGLVLGRVTRGGLPVSNGWVRLVDSGGKFMTEVPSRDDGGFRLYLPAGRWTLVAIDGADSVEQAVTVTRDHMATVELVLPVRQDSVTVTTIATPSLGNRSYLAVCDGEALAVDVPRDIDRVEAMLNRAGARLTAVVETHVHNDYVTGGWALARRHDASYCVPAGPRLDVPAMRVRDGDELEVGRARFRVVESPGHTDAHAAYAFSAAVDRPAAGVFTGGSMLYGAVGRTDLLGADRAEALARLQYWSIRRFARLLPGDALIHPTHGFGSFCSVGDASISSATLADEMERNPAFLLDEDTFVATVLGGHGEYPTYFGEMASLNRAGPEAADLTPPVLSSIYAVAELAERGHPVVDVRRRSVMRSGRIRGSVSVDGQVGLATYTGWLWPNTRDVAVVADSRAELDDAVRELSRIGRRVGAAALADEMSLTVAPDLVTTLAAEGFAQARLRLDAAPTTVLIDVRSNLEWRSGHLLGARHLPWHTLRRTTVPSGPLLVYCQAGVRATIAGSLLQAAGHDVVVIDDDLAQAGAEGLAWCSGEACGDEGCDAGARD